MATTAALDAAHATDVAGVVPVAVAGAPQAVADPPSVPTLDGHRREAVTALRALWAAGAVVPGEVDWSAAVVRDDAGWRLVIASTDAWIPSADLLFPEHAQVVVWLPLAWRGVRDPARVLLELAERDGLEVAALASTRSTTPDAEYVADAAGVRPRTRGIDRTDAALRWAQDEEAAHIVTTMDTLAAAPKALRPTRDQLASAATVHVVGVAVSIDIHAGTGAGTIAHRAAELRRRALPALFKPPVDIGAVPAVTWDGLRHEARALASATAGARIDPADPVGQLDTTETAAAAVELHTQRVACASVLTALTVPDAPAAATRDAAYLSIHTRI